MFFVLKPSRSFAVYRFSRALHRTFVKHGLNGVSLYRSPFDALLKALLLHKHALSVCRINFFTVFEISFAFTYKFRQASVSRVVFVLISITLHFLEKVVIKVEVM